MQYFLRKIGFYVVALWAALTLNFIIPRSCPGNPVHPARQAAAARGRSPRRPGCYQLLLGGDSSQPAHRAVRQYLRQRVPR